MSEAVAVHIFARIADLSHELAIAIKHQDMRIAAAVATNPDVSIGCDFDAMVRCRPGVAISGSTPGVNQIPIAVKFEDGRCGGATFCHAPVQA